MGRQWRPAGWHALPSGIYKQYICRMRQWISYSLFLSLFHFHSSRFHRGTMRPGRCTCIFRLFCGRIQAGRGPFELPGVGLTTNNFTRWHAYFFSFGYETGHIFCRLWSKLAIRNHNIDKDDDYHHPYQILKHYFYRAAPRRAREGGTLRTLKISLVIFYRSLLLLVYYCRVNLHM